MMEESNGFAFRRENEAVKPFLYYTGRNHKKQEGAGNHGKKVVAK